MVVIWVMIPYTFVNFYHGSVGNMAAMCSSRTLLTANRTTWCHKADEYSLDLQNIEGISC